MKKLLLTSTGLKNKYIKNEFLKLLEKPISEIKVIFIPAASRSEEELKYVKESKNELLDFGILEHNIKTLNLNEPVIFQEVEGFDLIYVCGGNTFYLLQKVRESGFDKIIKDFKGIYIGVSAGSTIVGPNVEVASPWDENDIGSKDTTGLNIADFAVSPHFKKEDQMIVNNLKKHAGYPIIELTDEQAILMVDGNQRIIGKANNINY